MPGDARLHPTATVQARAVLPVLLGAFGLAWGIFALFVLFPDEIAALMGAPGAAHPLFILAVRPPSRTSPFASPSAAAQAEPEPGLAAAIAGVMPVA
jgi:hypothetical protein